MKQKIKYYGGKKMVVFTPWILGGFRYIEYDLVPVTENKLKKKLKGKGFINWIPNSWKV